MTTLDALVVNVDALRRDVSLLHSHYWFEVQRLRRGIAKLKRKRDYWKQRALQAELEIRRRDQISLLLRDGTLAALSPRKEVVRHGDN